MARITQSNQIKITAAARTASRNTKFISSLTNIIAKFTFSFSIKFRRHRTVSYTSFISFENTINLIQSFRTYSSTRSCAIRTRSTRRNIRISSRINVKHCTLSAFKQNIFITVFKHFCSNIYTHRNQLVFVLFQEFFISIVQIIPFFIPVQISHTNTVTFRFHRISSTNATTSSTNRTFTSSITRFIHFSVTRKR